MIDKYSDTSPALMTLLFTGVAYAELVGGISNICGELCLGFLGGTSIGAVGVTVVCDTL